MHWDYFEPEKRDCSRECATKKYVDARDDTMLKTALDKIVEVNKDAQSDWTEQDPTKASYIKNKPDIPSTQQQADWAETNTSAVDYIKNKPTFATVATTGDYNDLSNKPEIPEVPTALSAFTNDMNYQNASQVSTSIATALTPYTPSQNLAAVATSGNYSDLLNKPTIPAAQVNADWNAGSGVAEILNKPVIPVVPTQVSAFNNDADYQSGSQVSSAIASAVAGITSFEYEIVQTLPATGRAGTIYLVPNTGTTPNIYDEYIYVSNAFEKIGTTEIDLTNYVQFTDIATVATSGSYNDLSDKPTIPVSQVNSDWNATSGVAEILNKPTLATVATSGSYNDLSNKPTIPAAQVNSDWNAASGVAQILNKPTLATVATSGSYNDLSNRPTIPTVNNATLTIQKNGSNVATFTANSSTNTTANITVPTITMQTTDPGEGAALAANNFIAVYQ